MKTCILSKRRVYRRSTNVRDTDGDKVPNKPQTPNSTRFRGHYGDERLYPRQTARGWKVGKIRGLGTVGKNGEGRPLPQVQERIFCRLYVWRERLRTKPNLVGFRVEGMVLRIARRPHEHKTAGAGRLQ